MVVAVQTALCGIHRYLYHVYSRTPPAPPPCAVTIHKTSTDQQWNGLQNSVRIKDRRSMCWQNTKQFDPSQSVENQNFARKYHGCFLKCSKLSGKLSKPCTTYVTTNYNSEVVCPHKRVHISNRLP